MRARSLTEDTVINSDDFAAEAKIVISDAPDTGPFYDPVAYLGFDPLAGAVIAADLEKPVVEATLNLHLGSGPSSISPYMTGGAWVGGRPLFDAGRYVRILTRIAGRYPGAPAPFTMPWRPIFTGRIDSSDPGDNDLLELHARDWYSDFLDRWIEPNPDGGSWSISGGDPASIFAQLMSLFLDGWTGPPGAPIVTIIGSPGFVIPDYRQDPGSGLLAMRSAALLNGWDFRGRFNASDQWVLTYNAPDRALTGPQLIFLPSRNYALRGLAKSRDDVRNRISVTPADAPRVPQFAEDPVSQTKYGLKFLGVAEDAASRIRTPAQALALAQAILLDTKEPKIMAVMDVNFQPLIEINDVLKIMPDNVRIDYPLTCAVSGYAHTFSEEVGWYTTLSTRDLPAAANHEWRAGGQKMLYSDTVPPSGVAAEGARWIQRTAA